MKFVSMLALEQAAYAAAQEGVHIEDLLKLVKSAWAYGALSEHGNSIKATSKAFGMNRCTIARYINSK